LNIYYYRIWILHACAFLLVIYVTFCVILLQFRRIKIYANYYKAHPGHIIKVLTSVSVSADATK